MPTVRPYPISTVDAQPIPNARVANAAAGDIASFGGNQAQDLMRAGAYLDKAADTTFNLYEREARQANDTRVEEEVNGFISAKQNTLYTKPDAFFRLKGEAAINGAQATTDYLLGLKKEALGRAANPYQREALTKRLDALMIQAQDGIDRHVVQENATYQKVVAAGRQTLLQNQASLDWNDSDKLTGLADAAEGVARKQAADNGVAGTDAEKAMVASARSGVYANAIEQRLANGESRSAVALYDKVKGGLDAKTNDALALKIKSTRTDIAADDLIASMAPNERRQEARQFFEAKGYSKEAASAMAGNFQWESSFNPTATHDGGRGFGIAGFDPSRTASLKKFAADRNMDPNAVKTQLEFSAWELDNTEKKSGDALKSAKSLEDANKAALGYFRPLDWTPQDATKSHGYSGRLTNAQGAYQDSGVGFDKVNAQVVADRVLNSSAPLEVRQAAYAKIQKQLSVAESARTAEIKGLDDQFEAMSMAVAAAGENSGVPKGTFADMAARYEAAGDKSKALTARFLASIEPTVYNFANAPAEAQQQIIALLSGKAKAVATAIAEGGRKTATADFSRESAAIKAAVEAGTPLSKLTDKLKGAIALGHQTGAPKTAQEFLDWAGARLDAEKATAGNPVQIDQTINDLRQAVAQGNQDNHTIFTLQEMERIQKQQDADFKRDAFSAGVKKYGLDLKPLKLDATLPQQLADRVTAANRIAAGQGGIEVLPFTKEEIAQIKGSFDQGNPQSQAQIMRTLSVLPDEAKVGVASALSGKSEGDQLSRSYAAAMTFIGDKDPAQQAIGEQILRGAQILKEGGAGGRKPAETSEAWQQALQDRIGNVFKDMSAKVPATIADAVASVYVARMWAAGRPGDKTDTDMLDASIKSVVGETARLRGQSFLPPRGTDGYTVDRALRTLTDADLGDMKTLSGSPVTADKVMRYGMLSNAGGEGRYFVSIPDPARNGDPGYLTKPDGTPFVLDIKPLLERQQTAPAVKEIDAMAARRRAPASPTANVAP